MEILTPQGALHPVRISIAVLLFLGFAYLSGGVTFLGSIALTSLLVWVLRHPLWSLFRSRRPWERQLAFGFAVFVLSLPLFLVLETQTR